MKEKSLTLRSVPSLFTLQIKLARPQQWLTTNTTDVLNSRKWKFLKFHMQYILYIYYTCHVVMWKLWQMERTHFIYTYIYIYVCVCIYNVFSPSAIAFTWQYDMFTFLFLPWHYIYNTVYLSLPLNAVSFLSCPCIYPVCCGLSPSCNIYQKTPPNIWSVRMLEERQ